VVAIAKILIMRMCVCVCVCVCVCACVCLCAYVCVSSAGIERSGVLAMVVLLLGIWSIKRLCTAKAGTRITI